MSNGKSNTHEQSMFPEGMTEEEAAMLSDIEILALLIAERRTKLSQDETQRMAGVRRRRRAVVAPIGRK